MNRPRIRRLAQHLDKVKPERFDMSHHCGTAVCIAGHTRQMARTHKWAWWPIMFEWFQEYLGLDMETAQELCYPSAINEDATAKQAAKVLRRLLRTGKVDWIMCL